MKELLFPKELENRVKDIIPYHRDWHKEKRTRTTSAGADALRKESSLIVGGKCQMICPFWKTIWTILKNTRN